MIKKTLSEILGGNQKVQELEKAWQETAPAEEYEPLPRGQYLAVVCAGEHVIAKTGTPGYKITFNVLEGEYKNRKIFLSLWLTSAAMPYTRRDLAKINITELAQLEKVPPRMKCKVHVVVRQNDDGVEYNAVRAFEPVELEREEPDPFAPSEDSAP